MISFELEKLLEEYKEAHRIFMLSNRKNYELNKKDFETIEDRLFNRLSDLEQCAPK